MSPVLYSEIFSLQSFVLLVFLFLFPFLSSLFPLLFSPDREACLGSPSPFGIGVEYLATKFHTDNVAP